MKHYIIALMPELATQKPIEDLRRQYVGTDLIDGLPPHVTLKSRFALKESATEDDLKNIVNTIHMHDVSIAMHEAAMMGGALVLNGESDYVREKHLEIMKSLAGSTIDLRPEFGGEKYKIHMTLLRGQEAESIPHLGEMRFDRICIYEIDPTLDRAYAHKILCKKLSS